MTRKNLFCIAILIVTLLFLSSIPNVSANTFPKLTGGAVSPSRSDTHAYYMFTVRYVDADNDAPAYMKVYIGSDAYDMLPVNPDDDNYTDGKDYYYRTQLSEGTYVSYFQCSDGTNETFTGSLSVIVDSNNILKSRHADLILTIFMLTPLALLICVFFILQLRKINKNLEKIAEDKLEKPSSDTAKTEEEKKEG